MVFAGPSSPASTDSDAESVAQAGFCPIFPRMVSAGPLSPASTDSGTETGWTLVGGHGDRLPERNDLAGGRRSSSLPASGEARVCQSGERRAPRPQASSTSPISSGARLASFLNSIFTVGSPKKVKIIASSVDGDQLACSFASSFSQSCLSNTPSSRSKPMSIVSGGGGGGPKQRSVRFYPVISVIVDEPGRQSKNLKMAAEISPTKAEFNKKSGVGDDKRRTAKAAREMLRSYQKKKESYDARVDDNDEDEDGGDDDGDAASCASSDLFELDNLASIGCDQMRYREELPVYETTNLNTN